MSQTHTDLVDVNIQILLVPIGQSMRSANALGEH